jgi:hypothetical protein
MAMNGRRGSRASAGGGVLPRARRVAQSSLVRLLLTPYANCHQGLLYL